MVSHSDKIFVPNTNEFLQQFDNHLKNVGISHRFMTFSNFDAD
jgi:hypothetical protein